MENSVVQEAIQPLVDDPRIELIDRALGPDAALCLVGGTLRDTLRSPNKIGNVSDLDLSSILSPAEARERLNSAGLRVIPTGLKHQTLTVLAKENTAPVELTTFRSLGMRPEGGVVHGQTIEEDLSYRDFTVNALAYVIREKRLVASEQALEDLRHSILRTVGDPAQRFSEDPLRILRLVRLASEHGFSIERTGFATATQMVKLLCGVSAERVREEFSRTLLSCRPADGFRNLQALGALQLFWPEISVFHGFEQNSYHKADLFEHTLEVVERSSSELTLRLAALFHDVGKPPTLSVDEAGERHFYRHESVGIPLAREALSRLRYPNQVIDDVCTLVATHMRPLVAGAAGLRRILRDTGELYPSWRALKESDSLACKIDSATVAQQLADFDATMLSIQNEPKVSALSNLAIRGQDLLELGIEAGPAIGKILRALHERVLDEPSQNDKATLLVLAKELAEKN